MLLRPHKHTWRAEGLITMLMVFARPYIRSYPPLGVRMKTALDQSARTKITSPRGTEEVKLHLGHLENGREVLLLDLTEHHLRYVDITADIQKHV